MFHCVVHPDAVARLSASQRERTRNNTTSTQTINNSASNTTEGGPRLIPVQLSTSAAPAAAAGVQFNPPPPVQQQQYTHPINGPALQGQGQGQQQQPYSIPIQGQSPQGTQAAIQQTINQLTAQPPIRPNIQVIPVQYQALLIKYYPPPSLPSSISPYFLSIPIPCFPHYFHLPCFFQY